MKSTNLYFSTFTTFKWIPILEKDEYKQIVVESLRSLVNRKRVVIYGFVIMPNHIHLIWHINEGYKLRDIQEEFLEHTEQVLTSKMLSSGKGVDPVLKPNIYNNHVRIWDRNGLSIHLDDYSMIVQKLGFMHKNPVSKKWRLCRSIEKYKYTSFHFYLNGGGEFDFLTSIYELENMMGMVENTDTIMSVAC